MPTPNIIPTLSANTFGAINAYLQEIKTYGLVALLQQKKMGYRLYEVLKDSDIQSLNVINLIDALLKTNLPLIFAESKAMLKGDGSDWTKAEIILLGRIARVVKDVTVYSKSTYLPEPSDFFAEDKCPTATLLFTNGALLEGCGADIDRVTHNHQFNKDKYDQFLAENLLPSLLFANEDAGVAGAVVTMPVLGGGQFAGKYLSDINNYFPNAIMSLIHKNSLALKNINAVIITGIPDGNATVNHIEIFRTKKAVGLYPQDYNPKFANYKTYTCVAADHVSFPGNDGYSGSPATHEGGTCTVTNVFTHITGVQGSIVNNKYSPPKDRWLEICANDKITLNFDSLCVFDETAQMIEYSSLDNDGYKPNYLAPDQPANYLAPQENKPHKINRAQSKDAIQISGSQNKPHKSNLFKRHPWIKNVARHVALGIGFGLCVIGVCALIIATSGSGALVVLSTGAAVGAFFGVSGSTALGIAGLTAIGAAVIISSIAFFVSVGLVLRCLDGKPKPGVNLPKADKFSTSPKEIGSSHSDIHSSLLANPTDKKIKISVDTLYDAKNEDDKEEKKEKEENIISQTINDINQFFTTNALYDPKEENVISQPNNDINQISTANADYTQLSILK